jgi:repressor of nif and glnA expression
MKQTKLTTGIREVLTKYGVPMTTEQIAQELKNNGATIASTEVSLYQTIAQRLRKMEREGVLSSTGKHPKLYSLIIPENS